MIRIARDVLKDENQDGQRSKRRDVSHRRSGEYSGWSYYSKEARERYLKSVRWYLDEKPISRENLEAELMLALTEKPGSTVYVDGKERVRYEDVMYAVDIIQRHHVRAVLETPDTRAAH